jgi:anti-anti-sigma regulatory factor
MKHCCHLKLNSTQVLLNLINSVKVKIMVIIIRFGLLDKVKRTIKAYGFGEIFTKFKSSGGKYIPLTTEKGRTTV